MSDQDIYDTHYNLWRIEESFRVIKSDFDARPVFLQKESTIKAHFLICYLGVLLERILQFKVLNNKYSTSDIMKFTRGFQVVKGETKYINTTQSSDFIIDLAKITDLPRTNYFLTEREYSVTKYKINCRLFIYITSRKQHDTQKRISCCFFKTITMFRCYTNT